MNELLLGKGFKLKSLEDGNWYVLEFEDIKDGSQIELLNIFGMDTEEYFDFAILQCDENFNQCSLMVDYEIYDIDTDKFKELVEKL